MAIHRPTVRRYSFHMPAALHPLTEKRFGVIWAGAFLSGVGFWIQTVAQGWQVLQLTNSALLLGLVSFIGTFPNLLLSLFGGAIADRFDRRKLLLITQSMYMGLALLQGLLTTLQVITVWHILLIALLTGFISTVGFPTWQTFITDLVDESEIKQGIALNSMQFNLSRVVGPAIGGLSIGIFGIAGSYYLNGLSYIAVIVPLLLMRPQSRLRKREVQSVWENVISGVAYIRQKPVLQIALGLQFMSSFFIMPYLTLLPVFAGNIFRTGATGLGTMNAVAGIGALLGSCLVLFLAGRLSRTISALFLLCLAGGLASIVFAQMPNQALTLPLLLILGASTVMANVFTNTTIQSSTPEEIRGRVVSIWVAIAFGFAPLGNLLAGSVAQASSAPFTLAFSGAVCIIVATAIVLLTRKVGQPILAAHS